MMGYMLDYDQIEDSRRCHYWMPLWRSSAPKSVLNIEKEAIIRIAVALQIQRQHIETVLNLEGEKTLRIKIFKVKESGVDMFDYFFFCPIVIENERMCYRSTEKVQLVEGNVTQNKTITILLNESDFIKKIHETIKASHVSSGKLMRPLGGILHEHI